MTTENDDMAGSVSEPGGVAPEVKPTKSLWPRPHDEVKIEPSLEMPPAEVAVAPPVTVAVTDAAIAVPAADIETVPVAGYQEPVLPTDEIKVEPALDRIEPVVEPGAVTPVTPAADIESVVTNDPEPLRVTGDERSDAILVAASEQKPPLTDPEPSGPSRFIAMAAGIIVALALGAVGLVYGASGLGLFGDKKVVASSAPAPAATPVAVANPEDLKAARQKIEELQARLDRAEAEKNAALDKAAAAEKGRTSVPPPAPAAERTAAVPAPVPSPVAAPSPTPAPAAQAAKSAPASPSTPAATASNTASSNPARSEPTPAPSAPAVPPVARPKPAETARVETAPPPTTLSPPAQQTQPSYQNQPGSQPAARQTSPEMPLLRGWAVRDVYNGVAVVQSGRGVPMEVQAGDELPGGNRVLAIRRLGGDWAVITEFGIIGGR